MKWRQRADPMKKCSPQDSSAEYSPSPGFSLYEQAYRRFCYDFVTPFPGALSRLPQLLFESTPDSCLCSAVAAVAYANFHSRCKFEKAKEAATVYYGKTLQKFAAMMADPVEIQRDDNLMVIFLMSMYEMLTSSTRDGSYLAHMHGAQSVIAHRDGSTLRDGNNHLALLSTHMIVWYLTDLKSPPLLLASWVQQIPFDSAPKKRLTRLISTTAAICARLEEQCGAEENFGHLFNSDLQEALEIDQELQRWTSDLPMERKYAGRSPMTHTKRADWAKKLLTMPGSPDHMHVYSTPLAASDWNMYRATRIRLWIQILKLVRRNQSVINVPALEERGLDILGTLTGEIAETIPYSITLSLDGSTDPKSPEDIPGMFAYSILWSTFTCFVCYQSGLLEKNVHMHRTMWFGAMLRFLRDTTGIAKVEVLLTDKRYQAS
ncbi:hypothetical protein N7507_011206 [Penicillium longicatenatum]|nr:hypothetical protein N7507_011206 [Penicillium longicatenatum]